MIKSKPLVHQKTEIEGPETLSEDVLQDHYNVNEDLGRGRFSVVRKCTHRHSGVAYAAKFLRKRRKGKDCEGQLLQEVSMLKLEHAHLVELVHVFNTPQELIIVTEYAAGGELFQHILEADGLSEVLVTLMLAQLLDGLHFLHNRGIVHLDIKPQNILLTKAPPHGVIKLCDFGFARTITCEDEIRDIIGTPDYVAPEVLNYEPLCTASDMWSVGVLCYVMLTACSPFTGNSKMETFSNITQIKFDFPEELFANISRNAHHFIQSLLLKEPEERLTACQCLQLPWFRAASLSPSTTKSHTSSPVGCRRALAGPDLSDDSTPVKKCKCDKDEHSKLCVQCQSPVATQNGSLHVHGEQNEGKSCTGHSQGELVQDQQCSGSPHIHSQLGQNKEQPLHGDCVHRESGINTETPTGEEGVPLTPLIVQSDNSCRVNTVILSEYEVASQPNNVNNHSSNGVTHLVELDQCDLINVHTGCTYNQTKKTQQ